VSAPLLSRALPHLCGMPKRLRDKRLIVVFKAFFDESGGPESSKALIMGGFLGRVEEWERASDAWDECLHQSPAIEYFKRREAQGPNGQFEGWDRPSADKKVLALATVISRFKLLGMCAIVPFGIFDGRDPKITKGMMGTRAYDLAFAGAVKIVLQHMKETMPEGEKVDFVFDDHSALAPNIDTFYTMKREPFFKEFMSPAGGCMPDDDKRVVALQMADLLAWEFSNHGKTRIMGDVLKLIRENNQIIYLRCDPPPQTNPTMRLYQLTHEVAAEAGKFLQQIKKPREGLTVQEIEQQVSDLLMRETYQNVEWGRLLLRLDADEEYQAFKKGYLDGRKNEDEEIE
jgi:Protein of unknown function (DUF3800)